jgi:hypothetical protein
MRRVLRVLLLFGICIGVIITGVSVFRVTPQSYQGTSSPSGSSYAIQFQQEALAHTPITDACHLPDKNAQTAGDKCVAACEAGCGGWCSTSAETRYGCTVGCRIMQNYANGSYTY